MDDIRHYDMRMAGFACFSPDRLVLLSVLNLPCYTHTGQNTVLNLSMLITQTTSFLL